MKQRASTDKYYDCFHLQETAGESYPLPPEAYGEHALSQDTFKRWFRRFRDRYK